MSRPRHLHLGDRAFAGRNRVLLPLEPARAGGGLDLLHVALLAQRRRRAPAASTSSPARTRGRERLAEHGAALQPEHPAEGLVDEGKARLRVAAQDDVGLVVEQVAVARLVLADLPLDVLERPPALARGARRSRTKRSNSSPDRDRRLAPARARPRSNSAQGTQPGSQPARQGAGDGTRLTHARLSLTPSVRHATTSALRNAYRRSYTRLGPWARRCAATCGALRLRSNGKVTTMGPLAGFRIIEMAGIGPAPFAAMLLADMGAEVIRVDRREATDLGLAGPRAEVRRAAPRPPLDRRRRQGRGRPRRSSSGWPPRPTRIIEGFRPGVMERLGLGPDELLAAQSEAGVRPHDRLRPGRPAGAGRRPRHQLHRARRRAACHRPQGRGAGAAAEPGRRFRRRRHVPGLRRRVRAAGGAEVGQGPGGGRRHGRRRGLR